MTLTVTFEDRDYKYEVPMEKLINILKLDLTIAEIENAVREALKQ